MHRFAPHLGLIVAALLVAAWIPTAAAFAQSSKPITFTVSGTYHSPGPAGCEESAPVLSAFSLTVPSASGSQRATVTTNLTSQPSGLRFCLRFYPSPGAPGCPPEQVKVQGLCYPSSANEYPASGTTPFDFSRYLPDSGFAWKMALSGFGPAGDYTVTGTISLAFPLSMTVAGTIGVTSPRQGETVLSGRPIAVTWTRRGQMDDQVRIELVNNLEPSVVQVLLASTANDGSAQCQAPPNQQGFYRIRVITIDGKVKGESGQFRIMPAPPER